MSAVRDASEALSAGLAAVPGLRVYPDPGARIDPPGAVVGPPSLTWEAACTGPTTARFLVYVITKADDRALDRLWDLVVQASDALDAVLDAVVLRADPGVYSSAGIDLPCYEIQVEMSL